MNRLKATLALLALLGSLAAAQTPLPGHHDVTLTWTASPATGVSYKVYRSTIAGSACGGNVIGTSTTTSFDDTSVVNGTTYFYVVTAVNTSGESICSNEVSAVIPTPPDPPTNLKAVVN